MRAMVLHEFGGPLTLEDVEKPRIGDFDVLVKVKACGVCGTDLKISAGGLMPGITVPHILGHESAGEVVEVGSRVEGVGEGDRVCVYFYVTCGNCEYCRVGREDLCINVELIGFHIDGGYADYLKVPARNIVKIPQEISYEEASILPDAVCTSLHALRERAKLKAGDDLLIMGTGGVGLHAVQIGKLCGARVITVDIVKERLQMAQEAGAEKSINSKEEDVVETVKELTKGRGVDVVLEVVGYPETVDISIECLKRGGKIILVGYSPERKFSAYPLNFVLNELEILGSRASTRQELHDTVNLVQAGKIKPIVTDTFSLEEANQLHKKLKAGGFRGRAVLKP